MFAVFKFDDEDVYYPPEYRIDDISGWMAGIMTETGIRGTFCVMGDRARVLKERGRDDVLQAMARHDLVSHQPGNRQPELVEILSGKEWKDGMQAVRDYEDRVIRDFEFAFGQPPQGLSRHGRQWAPQHVALAVERGISYQGNFAGVPGTEQPCWYAGSLCIGCHIFNPSTGQDEEITPEFGINDMVYSCNDAFNRRFEEMKRHVDACAERGVEFIHLFGAHPSRVLSRGFLETRCLAGGRNRPVEEVGFLYGVLDAEAEERAKANFRKVCEFIRDHPALECKGITELAEAFSSQPANVTRDEMTSHAQEMTLKRRILLHRTFSPAELLTGMAESLVAAGADGHLPDAVERRNVMGPAEIPTIGPEVSSVSHAVLLRLCRETAGHVMETGHLPGNLRIDGNRIGIGQLAILAARAYAAQSRYDRHAVLDMDADVRYPSVAWNVDAKVRRIVHEEGRFDPDMGSDKLAKHARLQTWTLKPAWLEPPRGGVSHEGRIYLRGQE